MTRPGLRVFPFSLYLSHIQQQMQLVTWQQEVKTMEMSINTNWKQYSKGGLIRWEISSLATMLVCCRCVKMNLYVRKNKRYFFTSIVKMFLTTYINHSYPFPLYHEYAADDFKNMPENISELTLNESTIIE